MTHCKSHRAKILVPVDGSQTSNLALAAALQLAKESQGMVLLVHLIGDSAYMGGYDAYGAYAAHITGIAHQIGVKILADGLTAAKAAGVQADQQLIETLGEHLGDTVAQTANHWKADLIVVGTHGRRGVGRMFLGSGAEQIIRLSPVPVLVIRSHNG